MAEAPEVCDFCAASRPSYRYVVAPISAIRPALLRWSACAHCHELIEGGRREALARRGLRPFASCGSTANDEILRRVRQLHHPFWTAWDAAMFDDVG